MNLLCKIICAFTYSGTTINPCPVCGTKEPYLISDGGHSVFQVLKAFISAASVRIAASKLHITIIGRNVGEAFEGDTCNVVKWVKTTIDMHCSNAYPVLESYYRIHCNMKHKLNIQYP